MQNVNFQSIDDFLDFLPARELELVEILRGIIGACLPEAEERLSYNVPYYYGKRRICFIWPSSVPWGNVKKDGVLLGFCYGHLLPDEEGYLEKGNRKQVLTKTFNRPGEIEPNMIRYYLFEAAEIDNGFRKK